MGSVFILILDIMSFLVSVYNYPIISLDNMIVNHYIALGHRDRNPVVLSGS